MNQTTENKIKASSLLEKMLSLMPEILIRDLDESLCVCNEVTKRTVIASIVDGASNLEQVKSKTYAGDGTGCCQRQIKRLIEAVENVKGIET